MSRTIPFVFSLVVFIFPALLSGQSSDTLQLEEIVVVHSKVPVPSRSTIKPVQVISRETLESQTGKDVAQILNEVAGIMVNGAYSNPGKDKSLYIRGAGSEFSLILIDGQPLLDPSGVGGAIDLRLLSANQFERIEILKGSQSTLYGSDAVSGVINLVTRGAAEKELSGHVRAAYGSFETYQTQAGLNGSLGKFSYRADWQFNQTEGISEALKEDPGAAFDKDGFIQQSARLDLGYAPNEHFDLKAFVRKHDFSGDFDDGAFADAPNTYGVTLFQTGLSARYRSDKTTFWLNAGHMDTDRSFETAWGTSNYRGFLNQIDTWFSSEISEAVRLQGGINTQFMRMKDPLAVEIDPDAGIWSAYATVLLNPIETFGAELGYRFNQHSTFGNNHNVSLSGKYRLLGELQLFGSYTTGFKAPNLSQLYGQYGANPDLQPQLSSSMEAGVQYGFQGDRLYMQASWFRRDIKDLIAYDYFKGFFNQSRQEDRGVELDAGFRLGNDLMVTATYTWLDGQVRTPLSADRDTTYNNLFRRPKHQFSAGLHYRAGERWQFNLQWQQTGSRSDLFFNPANFYISEAIDLESYGLLNVYASWDAIPDKLRVFLDVKNATNRQFQEVYGFASMPRNLMLGANWSF